MKYINIDDEKTVKDVLYTLSVEACENSARHGFYENFEKTVYLLADEPDLAAQYLVDQKLAKMALLHSELGEATEGIRKPGPDQHCPEYTQEEIELADVLIRAFDYAGKWGLRLGPAVLEKMKYNESRPYKHEKAA